MAPENGSPPKIMRFATFEVDLQARELRKSGLKLKLQGQPLEVLAMLLEKPGEVVVEIPSWNRNYVSEAASHHD